MLRRTVEGAVLAMSHVVETRDPYTAGHERRVSELATALATEMGMNGAELEALRLGGLSHDSGKVAVPAEILAKPGRLSEVEFTSSNSIPSRASTSSAPSTSGARSPRWCGSITSASMAPATRGGSRERTHSRRPASSPSLTSSRRCPHTGPYRAALGIEVALTEVREHAGLKYDAEVVAACVRLVEEQGFQFTP